MNFHAVCANSAPDQSEDFTASLADSLAKVVKVEKPHVLTYLRLRSDNSVRELTDLLKDYSASQKAQLEIARPPSRADAENGRLGEERKLRDPTLPPSRPESRQNKAGALPTADHEGRLPGTPLPGESSPTGASQPPPCPKKNAATTEAGEVRDAAALNAAKERLSSFPNSVYRSSYTGCWLGGEVHQRKKKEALEGTAAFAKVWRPECVEGLERWKATGAGEKKVKALAEKCRGLYSVWSRVTGPKTHYRGAFFFKKGTGAVKITKDRNRSEVPIGSIYSIDPWELEASEVRVKELMGKLQETKLAQEKMKTYMLRPKEEKQLVSYPPVANSLRESAEVKACFSICARATGRSEYRTKYQY